MTEPDLIYCVKCGAVNPPKSGSCLDCTWPFSEQAWQSTTCEIRRVTIDTSCINIKRLDSNLNRLEAWASECKIQLQRSDALIAELKGEDRIKKARSIDTHPQIWELGISTLGIYTFLAGPDMSEPIREILFPTTKILTQNQEYDLEHLRSHVFTGGDVFVTKNPKDFIVRGKAESLAQLGIWVFNPETLITFLSDLYGWKIMDGYPLAATGDPVPSRCARGMNDQAGRTVRRDLLSKLYDWNVGIAGAGTSPGIPQRTQDFAARSRYPADLIIK